ncbi:TPA: hypothetical protein OUL50_002547 [Clostridioides difficile]|nr:hypothetical protein [Clostridioides difficile]
MYLLFRHKGIMPSVSYRILRGEKEIVSVFMDQELDERKEEIKSGAWRLF